MAAWQAGVAGADAEAFRRFGPRLHRFASRRLTARADAADVVQDTFVRASMRIHQLRDPSRFGAWLYAIAGNRVHDLNSRREIPRDIDDEMLPVSTDPHADDEIVHGYQRDRARVAASMLNHRDRQIIDLLLWRGLSSGEIASALGLKSAHAYVLVGRARTRLATILRVLDLVESDPGYCPSLDSMRDANGPLEALVRRAGRHLEICPVCVTRACAIEEQGVGLLTARSA